LACPPLFPDADDILFESEDIFDFFGGLISISIETVGQYDYTWSFLFHSHRYSYQLNEKKLSILQLAHFSVQEYLFSPRAGYWTLAGEASHLSIIQYSIAYYLHAVAVDGISPLPPDKLLEKHSLAEYCCRYMSHHLIHLTPHDHPTLTSLFRLLLHPESNQIANKFGFLFFHPSGDDPWDDFKGIPISDNPGPSLALILAAHLGLSGVASWLLTFNTVQEQIDTSVSDFGCGPPILGAAAKGHTDVIRLLLENGADINQEGKYGQNALCDASENRQEAVVRMLIEDGACVNNEGGTTTPIEVASEKGHKGIVEMLIKAGADVNLGYEPALYCASNYGHEDVVQQLILADADVNLEGDLGTALHAASHNPGRKIVELLIDAGADVNKLAGEYGTALQAAIMGEDVDDLSALEVVRILIRAGANVNLVGGEYGTVLQAAAYWNWPKIVEELIDAGADVNLVGGEYGTALRAAVLLWDYDAENRIDIVQMLIRAGADVNLKGGKDTTPLEEALAWDHSEIAQILLDAGAKPPKRPLLSPTDSESDASKREGKRPRICDCTVADAECVTALLLLSANTSAK
jgi:ankyrin repeat protein